MSVVEILRIPKPYTRAIGVLVPLAALFIAACCFADPAETSSGKLQTYAANIGSSISVQSHDQLERWTATSNSLTGTLRGSRENLSLAGTGATLTVVLETLQSGNSSRDHSMYDMFDTKHTPNATLTVDTLHGPILPNGKPVPVTFDGSLTLHGVTQKLAAVPATLTYSETAPAPTIRLQTTFTIRLNDYRLKAPRFLFIKVAQDQKVSVDLTATQTPTR